LHLLWFAPASTAFTPPLPPSTPALRLLYTCFTLALRLLYTCLTPALSQLRACFTHASHLLYTCFTPAARQAVTTHLDSKKKPVGVREAQV
jgi:hypothetical protein